MTELYTVSQPQNLTRSVAPLKIDFVGAILGKPRQISASASEPAVRGKTFALQNRTGFGLRILFLGAADMLRDATPINFATLASVNPFVNNNEYFTLPPDLDTYLIQKLWRRSPIVVAYTTTAGLTVDIVAWYPAQLTDDIGLHSWFGVFDDELREYWWVTPRTGCIFWELHGQFDARPAIPPAGGEGTDMNYQLNFTNNVTLNCVNAGRLYANMRLEVFNDNARCTDADEGARIDALREDLEFIFFRCFFDQYNDYVRDESVYEVNESDLGELLTADDYPGLPSFADDVLFPEGSFVDQALPIVQRFTGGFLGILTSAIRFLGEQLSFLPQVLVDLVVVGVLVFFNPASLIFWWAIIPATLLFSSGQLGEDLNAALGLNRAYEFIADITPAFITPEVAKSIVAGVFFNDQTATGIILFFDLVPIDTSSQTFKTILLVITSVSVIIGLISDLLPVLQAIGRFISRLITTVVRTTLLAVSQVAALRISTKLAQIPLNAFRTFTGSSFIKAGGVPLPRTILGVDLLGYARAFNQRYLSGIWTALNTQWSIGGITVQGLTANEVLDQFFSFAIGVGSSTTLIDVRTNEPVPETGFTFLTETMVYDEFRIVLYIPNRYLNGANFQLVPDSSGRTALDILALIRLIDQARLLSDISNRSPAPSTFIDLSTEERNEENVQALVNTLWPYSSALEFWTDLRQGMTSNAPSEVANVVDRFVYALVDLRTEAFTSKPYDTITTEGFVDNVIAATQASRTVSETVVLTQYAKIFAGNNQPIATILESLRVFFDGAESLNSCLVRRNAQELKDAMALTLLQNPSTALNNLVNIFRATSRFEKKVSVLRFLTILVRETEKFDVVGGGVAGTTSDLQDAFLPGGDVGILLDQRGVTLEQALSEQLLLEGPSGLTIPEKIAIAQSQAGTLNATDFVPPLLQTAVASGIIPQGSLPNDVLLNVYASGTYTNVYEQYGGVDGYIQATPPPGQSYDPVTGFLVGDIGQCAADLRRELVEQSQAAAVPLGNGMVSGGNNPPSNSLYPNANEGVSPTITYGTGGTNACVNDATRQLAITRYDIRDAEGNLLPFSDRPGSTLPPDYVGPLAQQPPPRAPAPGDPEPTNPFTGIDGVIYDWPGGRQVNTGPIIGPAPPPVGVTDNIRDFPTRPQPGAHGPPPVRTIPTTGATGPPGPPGTPAVVLRPNATGPTGPIGARGQRGPRGFTGPTGPAGFTGPASTQPGPTGALGAVGPLGPIGQTGPTGTGGFTGPTGLMGPNNPTPNVGMTGAVGPTGFMGPTGLMGLPGSPGPAGPTGVGITMPGTTGPVGPTGLGVPGPAGPTGPDTGTIGDTGPTGATGPSFPTPGAAGDTGPTGITGVTGMGEPISFTIFPLDSPFLTILSIAEDSAEVFTDNPHGQDYYTVFPYTPGAGSYVDALDHPGVLRLTGATRQLDWNNSATHPGFLPNHGLNEFSCTLRFAGTPSAAFTNPAVSGYVQFAWFRTVGNVAAFPAITDGFVALANIVSGIITSWRLQWWSGGVKTVDTVAAAPPLTTGWHDYRFTMPATANSVAMRVDGVAAGSAGGAPIPFGTSTDDRLAMRWRYALSGVPGGVTPHVDLDRVYLRIRRTNKVAHFP